MQNFGTYEISDRDMLLNCLAARNVHVVTPSGSGSLILSFELLTLS